MTQWQATFRQLLRSPAFTFTALLLLAAAVAINMTVFTVVDTVLLKPLPYPNSDRLVSVLEANPSKKQNASLVAPARLEDWNKRSRTFTAISGGYSENVTETSTSRPERLAALRVVPRFFQVYGRQPLIGRTFNGQEETYGGSGAAVISYGLWNRRFNRGRSALGSRLLLGGKAYTIVGVMPATFGSPATDVWLSAPMNPYLAKARDARFLTAVGRMRPGVTEKQAWADLDELQKQLGVEFPNTDKNWTVLIESKKQQLVGEHAKAIWMAFAGTSLLLVLSCINIASLLIGRIYQRDRELAVRASLGATRLQVLTLILREIGVISMAGCSLGVLLSYWSIEFISKKFAMLPRMSELAFDERSVLFGCGLGILFLLFVALLLMVQNKPLRLSEVLAQSGRSQASVRHPFQRYLLVGQFALTVILLCSAGLLLRTYVNLSGVNTGFDARNVITFHIGAEWSEDRTMVGRVQQEIIAELSRLPGVEAVGMTNFLPTDGATLRYQYRLSGGASNEVNQAYTAGSRTVTSGYLNALRIPVLQGKTCPVMETDLNKPGKALVNRAFIEHFTAGSNPVGEHLLIMGIDYGGSPDVIGVVGDVREDNAAIAAAPYVYYCASAGGWPDPEYVVRVRSDAAGMLGAIRKTVQRIAPTRAVFGLQTMEQHVATELGQPLLTAQMLTAFAIAALILAAFGLYSLTSLTVAAQTREIGTRMALGAYSTQVIGEVFARASKLIVSGVLVGIVGAVAAGQVLRSLLFGVSPEDPVTFLVVVLVLAVICFLATLIPALRAASIDPIEALRID